LKNENIAQQRPFGTKKTVLITGCSSGIGTRLVRSFLQQGWRVIATMRKAQDRLELFSDDIQQYGENLIVENLDVTSLTDRTAIVECIKNLEGSRLDCLVNNAGYALFGALENCSDEQLREQYDVNLLAPVLLTRAMLPFLRESKGSIINVSSVFSFVGFPMSSTYCSSKAGLSMLSECLKHELEPFGVRVHVVEPGGFRTGFISNGQWAENDIGDYQVQTEGLHKLQTKLSSGQGKDPGPVISRIVSLASSDKGSFRNRVGRDAWVSQVFHKILPDGIRLQFMGLMFRRMFQ